MRSARFKAATKTIIDKTRHSKGSIKRKLAVKVRRPLDRYRNIKRKGGYAVKLASSSRERQQYRLLRSARLLYVNEEWSKSIEEWTEIISRYGRSAPIEAYIKLSRSYCELEEFKQADELLFSAARSVYQAGDNKPVTQDNLQKWLNISSERARVHNLKRLNDISGYQTAIDNYIKAVEGRSKEDLRIAVVTAVSGGYDTIKYPVNLDSRFDYIIYTDTPVENPGIYDIRPLPYIDADNTRSARYVKSNLHNLLPDYDYVVWIDANILIIGDIYKSIVQPVVQSNKSLGAMLHPTRSSVYDEMSACIKAGKDDVNAIIEQRDRYQKEGFDSDLLIESNILVCRVKDDEVKNFMSEWWSQIDRFSRRDQLSINYSLDKHNVDWMTFTNRPDTSRNHKDVALMEHGGRSELLYRITRGLSTSKVDPLKQVSYSQQKKKRLSLVKDKTITVVVCVHNALEDTKLCLESIDRFKTDNQDLIIVDDGSDMKTEKFLIEFERENGDWVTLIRHNEAKGYTASASRGLEESSADFTVLLNSDTIVTEDWANKMSDVAFSSSDIGIVGPMSSAASTQSIPDYRSSKDQTAINDLPMGVSIDDMNRYCEDWSSADLIPRVPLVHGFCFGVKREVIESIGLLDIDSFPRGYGEENDYCFRAADAGFSLAIATNTYVFHTKSKSFVSEDRKRLMQEGARAFRDKHGQRRITRAVSTMQDNAILKQLRKLAESLYVKQMLTHVDLMDEEYFVSVDSMHRYSHSELVESLGGINSELNWSKPKKINPSTVSVIVLVLNNPEMSIRCIESIISTSHSNTFNIELIVVNNGSDIGTAKMLRDFKVKSPSMKLVHIEHNVNFSLGNNIGSTYATGDKLVFLNNDTIVTSHWLDSLIKPLEDGQVVASQPLLLYPDGDIQSMGIVFSDKSDLGYGLYVGESGRNKRVVRDRRLQAVTGACLAVSSNDFRMIRGFDTAFVNGQEDVDLCLRLRDRVVDSVCAVASRSIVYHDESRTPGRSVNNLNNRQEFLSRWSGRLSADDKSIYDSDGYVVRSYKKDSTLNRAYETDVYTPVLGRK